MAGTIRYGPCVALVTRLDDRTIGSFGLLDVEKMKFNFQRQVLLNQIGACAGQIRYASLTVKVKRIIRIM
jgi:hypothetical protein